MDTASSPRKPRKLDNTRNHHPKPEVIRCTMIDFSKRAIVCNCCHEHAELSANTYTPEVLLEVSKFKIEHGDCKIREC